MVQKFLGRLKQRNVFRVAGLYAVTGYAVFQICNNLLPALNLPRWTVSLVAVLFLCGFPIAMIVAYAFEKTDGGFRRTTPQRLATADGLGWFDWTLLAAIVAIIGIAIAQFAGLRVPMRPAVTAAAAAPGRSIAVLPFVNFGDSRDDDYFADGLTEELINGLAQLPDLHVAGRTSTFYFKGRNEDLREVGRKLGVTHVLEGSVRRSGLKLRITAQLIKVDDGFHLWSQTYDRPWSDAFAIQSQIAAAVAQVLKVQLLGATPAAGTRPRDPQAFQLELVARSHLRKRELAELQAARELYRQLMELEPDNPRAYTGFAEATVLLTQNHLALDFDTAMKESQRAIEQALQIDPQSAEAWRVRGMASLVLSIRSSDATQADAALASFRRAVELDPQDSDALAMLADQLSTRRQPEQAIALLRQALAVDPLSRVAQHLLGTTLRKQGKFGEARRQLESVIKLYPDYTSAQVGLGQLLMEQGKLDEAAVALNDAQLIRTDPLAGIMLANCYANLGMDKEMTELLESIREPPTAAAVAKAALLLRTGRRTEFTQLAATQLAETRDPVWRAVMLLDTVLTGDPRALRALVSSAGPELKKDPPAVGRFPPLDALLFASALRATGSPEQANRIASLVLASSEATPREYNPIDSLLLRTQAFALMGRVDEAIAELQRAEAQGYRNLVDIEYFVRLDEYPFMAQVARDGRFKALVARVETDLERMRNLLRSRESGGAAR